jgi:hypothetical protein
MLLRNIRAEGGFQAAPFTDHPRLMWAAFAAQSKGIQPLENPDQWNAAIGCGYGGLAAPANRCAGWVTPAPGRADWPSFRPLPPVSILALQNGMNQYMIPL